MASSEAMQLLVACVGPSKIILLEQPASEAVHTRQRVAGGRFDLDRVEVEGENFADRSVSYASRLDPLFQALQEQKDF